MKNYPYMLFFLNNAFLEEEQDAVSEVSRDMDMISDTLQKIYKKADLGRFKDGVDPSKVLKSTLFTMDGLLKEQMSLQKFDAKQLYDESVEYLDLYKRCYYKEK